ncbi:MAG: hypothetical protein J3R72DRAFT_437475, partial [Linnemannia gamsii]
MVLSWISVVCLPGIHPGGDWLVPIFNSLGLIHWFFRRPLFFFFSTILLSLLAPPPFLLLQDAIAS